MELRVGDFVRVSALTAAAALPADSNPHAHLPRAHADCLHPLRGARGCPTTHVLDALERTRYNQTAAAKVLGISFRALRYRIQRLGIKQELDAKP
jgi:transcriptional regulator with GAF, ATPase, and Fis domain